MPWLSWMDTLDDCGVFCQSFMDDASNLVIAHAYFLLFNELLDLHFPIHVLFPVFFGQLHSGWPGRKMKGEVCDQGK